MGCVSSHVQESTVHEPLLISDKMCQIVDNMFVGYSPTEREIETMVKHKIVDVFVSIDNTKMSNISNVRVYHFCRDDVDETITFVIDAIMYEKRVHISSTDLNKVAYIALIAGSLITNESVQFVQNRFNVSFQIDAHVIILAYQYVHTHKWDFVTNSLKKVLGVDQTLNSSLKL